MTSQDHHLEQIHRQLAHWQDNLATRVASEARALDAEIGKLHDQELDDALQVFAAAHAQVIAGCDSVRDLRRRLQTRRLT